jgi:hypothetical protein
LRALSDNADPVPALRGLWTLYAMGATDTAILRSKLSHPDEHVRTWAIRMLSDSWSLDTVTSQRPKGTDRASEVQAILPTFVEMARTDASGLVRLALASTLQRLPYRERVALASELVARAEDAMDHNQPLLVWYGLIGLGVEDPAGLVKIAQHCALPLTRQCIARRLAENIEKTPEHLNSLLEFTLNAPREFQSDILKGLGLAPDKFFIVSMHREENVDTPQNFRDLVETLNALAEAYNQSVIVSTHPRTRKRLDALELGKLHPQVQYLKPFGFCDYVKLQMEALCVVSDSGTITEEGSMLNLPAITIRNTHERPEGMDAGTLIMSGLKKERVLDSVRVILAHHNKQKRVMAPVADYEVSAVSKQMLRIVLSYVDYVNRTVWSK